MLKQQKHQEEEEEELRSKIVAKLSIWACEDEINYLKKGVHYVAPDKLTQMDQFLQDKETTNAQKAHLAKAMLTQGHLDFMKQKLDRSTKFLSLPLLLTIGCLALGLHGMAKSNKKEQLSAIFMGTAACFLAEHTKQKFSNDTKESHYFLRILSRDKQEQQHVANEYLKWFTQSRYG